MSQAEVSGPGGNIYDLGYQAYDGPRLGRRAGVKGARLFVAVIEIGQGAA